MARTAPHTTARTVPVARLRAVTLAVAAALGLQGGSGTASGRRSARNAVKGKASLLEGMGGGRWLPAGWGRQVAAVVGRLGAPAPAPADDERMGRDAARAPHCGKRSFFLLGPTGCLPPAPLTSARRAHSYPRTGRVRCGPVASHVSVGSVIKPDILTRDLKRDKEIMVQGEIYRDKDLLRKYKCIFKSKNIKK